jgi:hypothetical protein
MKILDSSQALRCNRMMRGVSSPIAAIAAAAFMAGCGGQVQATDPTPPAQEPYGVIEPGGGTQQNQSTEEDRITAHEGQVVASVHLRIVYVGTKGVDQALPVDDFAKWLVTSEYWETLSQYGVNKGVVLDSVEIPAEVFAPDALRETGNALIEIQYLDLRFATLVHGDANNKPYPGLAGADAYAIYLPDGLNVSLGHRDNYELTTCVDAFGYHAHDGTEPYAVLPPCSKGRSTQALSHELTELVTDPVTGVGWMSDGDASKNGGEVADLCDHPITVEGHVVTQLWSNKDGQCVPYEP